jgi:hypothetical protein
MEVAVSSRAVELYPELERYLSVVASEIDRIPADRQGALARLTEFVAERVATGQPARLTFICTHNSRRSQMAQIWAQTAAAHFGVPAVEAYSGGTEASAFNPRAVAALGRAGFRIEARTVDQNPVCAVQYGTEAEPMECFSKVFDQPPNPREGFAAVMTCSAADAACPVVLGAAERISLPYDDPQDFDGTDRETAAYDERCQEIACEMLYAFSRIKR